MFYLEVFLGSGLLRTQVLHATTHHLGEFLPCNLHPHVSAVLSPAHSWEVKTFGILRSAPLRWRSLCVTREDAGLQVWLQPVALAHHRPPVGGGAVPLGRPPKP